MPRGPDTLTGRTGPAGAVPPSNGARPLPKRRTLPNGRAALGGLLVAAATVVLYSIADARTSAPTEHYVVARHTLALGTHISPGDLRTAPLHVPAGALRKRIFRDARLLVGAVVIAPVEDGELIQASAVARAADPGLRQISVPVEAARSLGNRLQPGELVDVLATFGTGADAFTVSVVNRARVIGRDTSGGALGDQKGQVVVLAVTSSADAMAVAHAVAAGQVSLIRVSGTSPEPHGEPAPPYRAPRPSGR